MVFTQKYPGDENHFYPLFNDANEINGTQWNLKNFKV